MLKQTLDEAHWLLTRLLFANNPPDCDALSSTRRYLQCVEVRLNKLQDLYRSQKIHVSIQQESLLIFTLRPKSKTVQRTDGSGDYMSVAMENQKSPQPRKDCSNKADVAEHDVLRELLSVFQGVGSENFFNKSNDGFTVSSQLLQGAPALYHLASHLADLGTLHLKVCHMVDSVPLVGAPLCLSALATAMRGQLSQFMLMVSQLQSKLADKNQATTLLQFRVMTQSAMQHMKGLAIVAETCGGKKGGTLLTALDKLIKDGDHSMLEYLQPLFAEVARVYYGMLGKWLKAIEFYDPNSEFFIAKIENCHAKHFWKKNYHHIRSEGGMLPAFISEAQAQEVLVAGRSVALLQTLLGQDCSLTTKLKKVDAAISTAINTEQGYIAWLPNGVMQKCVKAVMQQASQQLVHAMLDKGKLSLHLHALAGHLLLKKGRFARELISRVGPYLDQPASNILLHQLKIELEFAIIDSKNNDEDLDMEALLEVKLMQTSEASTLGWDAFTLSYFISSDDPVTMIISEEAMEKYLLLFKELLRAKRIEWVLSNILKTAKTQWRVLHPTKGGSAEASRGLHLLHLLVSQVNLLLQQLVCYLHHHRIEQQWRTLQDNLTSAASLEKMIEAHDLFLDNILHCVFFDKDPTEIKRHLESLYSLVLQLEELCGRLTEAREDCSSEGGLENLEDRCSELRHTFDKWMHSFLVALHASSEELQVLMLHINFNNFYNLEG